GAHSMARRDLADTPGHGPRSRSSRPPRATASIAVAAVLGSSAYARVRQRTLVRGPPPVHGTLALRRRRRERQRLRRGGTRPEDRRGARAALGRAAGWRALAAERRESRIRGLESALLRRSGPTA